MIVLLQNGIKKCRASLENISIRHIKPLGIPRIGDITAAGGEIHQLMHLSRRIAAENAEHTPDIGAVHADEQIVFVIVALLQLHRALAIARQPMPFKLGFRRRIDRIADPVPNFFRLVAEEATKK